MVIRATQPHILGRRGDNGRHPAIVLAHSYALALFVSGSSGTGGGR
jgi:hypothetical protein